MMSETRSNRSLIVRLKQGLRSGKWLTTERMWIIAVIILLEMLLVAAYLVVTSEQNVDKFGRPIGTDFSNIYAAGTYVREGNASAAYDPALQFQRQKAIFGEDTLFYGWFYPPFFFSIAGLLAVFSYGNALIVWLGITLALYVWTMLRILRISAPDEPQPIQAYHGLCLLLIAAYPAVFVNIGHGHNGLLSAVLLGGGMLLLNPKPLLAGILIGLLSYKPQFGILIPLALAAGGYWRSFFSASATVCVLIVAATATYGVEIWAAFLESTGFTRNIILEQGGTGWQKIQTLFSWVRLWGGPVWLAYVVQAACTLSLALLIIWLWRRETVFALKAASLCVAVILATPYALDYDLLILAPAIGFFAVDGLKRGFLPWEKTVLATVWLMPLIARQAALHAFIPLGAITMLVFLFMIYRRARDKALT